MPAAVSSLTPSGIGMASLALIATFSPAAIAADRGDDPLPKREAWKRRRPNASMVPATSPPGEWGSVGVT